jgi:hypothetical protein
MDSVKTTVTKHTNMNTKEENSSAPPIETAAAETSANMVFSFPLMEIDPVANIFPMIEGKDFDDLVEDIRQRGLDEPICTYEGKIIDGRNRYLACQIARVMPRFRTWDGKGTVLAYVLSANLHRRHLTASQRAVIAAEMAVLGRGRRANTQHCAFLTVNDVAKALAVSPRSVNTAHTVMKKSVRKMIEEIKAGYLSLSEAAKISQEPPARQMTILAERAQASSTAGGRKRFRRKLSAPADSGSPDQKLVNDLSQHLMFAARFARQCGYLDVQTVVNKARRLFENHQNMNSEKQLPLSEYNSTESSSEAGE